ncbi:MAG: hypothetical protein JXA93_22700 [Anaerolineae bacterium]|nr:hypothetical protein [Anaerolineae bacterium]
MSLGSLLQNLFKKIGDLIAPKPEPAPPPPVPAMAETLAPRVLLIVYDPTIPTEGGRKLSQVLGWNRVDDLVPGYISDLRETSGGFVDYQVVQRIDVDAWPAKVDGFRYDAQRFLQCHQSRSGWHDPDTLNYEAVIDEFDLVARVNRDQIDEVWMFGFPHAGFYESRMVGRGAFWCNGPEIERPDASRRFVIMGFNYERGVGEMLESFGHRVESHMEYVWRRMGTHPDRNLWKRFILYDKVAPGQAHCGTVHFAPNSVRDYDWDNPTPVDSYCDDWYRFPEFPGQVRRVDNREWRGDGTVRVIRGHHTWWLRHLPRVEGEIHGISNNWWWYAVDPNAAR